MIEDTLNPGGHTEGDVSSNIQQLNVSAFRIKKKQCGSNVGQE